MIDLERIKKRYSYTQVDESTQWVKDIDALVAEVERLRAALHEVALPPFADSDPESLLMALRARAQSILNVQSCGHPRSAIVSADDLGSDGTGYCGMCEEESKSEESKRENKIHGH